ncbi:MAG: hypothetical protein ACI9UN_000362 [Granulosicoccus sp.]|jgi:hypothetical protein
MNAYDLEETYELLAKHIDKFDEAKAPVYLAKVALLMATEIDDMDLVRRCIQAAAEA